MMVDRNIKSGKPNWAKRLLNNPNVLGVLRGLAVSVPGIGISIPLKDLVAHEDVDTRIAKLSTIKQDLLASIAAIDELEKDASSKKRQLNELDAALQRLQSDKITAESLLNLPEESLARVLANAAARGRGKGILQGLIMGFATGVLSSLLVWYITRVWQ